MDARKKNVLAVGLVIAVAAMGYWTFMSSPSNDERFTAATNQGEAPAAAPTEPSFPPNAGLDDIGRDAATPAETVSLGAPGSPPIEASPTETPAPAIEGVHDVPAPTVPVAVASPSPAERSPLTSASPSDDVDQLLQKSQRGDLMAKVAKTDADMRRTQAEARAKEAEAELAALKAQAEANYIRQNPDRYASQAMKSSGAGGFDASVLPALTPGNALAGFNASGSDTSPSLRMISGTGKERMAVILYRGQAYTVQVGHRFDTYTVRAITEQSVELDHSGRRMTLGFSLPPARPLENQNPPAEAPRNVPAVPRIAQPAGDSTSVPGVASVGPSAMPSGGMQP